MAKKDAPVTKTDIELCFKALGLPYDASPERVDLAYEAFMLRSKRNLQSADPVKLERTRADMDLISDIHFRIRKSVTYADRKKHAASQLNDSGGVSIGVFAIIAMAVAIMACGVWYVMT